MKREVNSSAAASEQELISRVEASTQSFRHALSLKVTYEKEQKLAHAGNKTCAVVLKCAE